MLTRAGRAGRERLRRFSAAALVVFATSCGDSNPGGPSQTAPVLLCPAPQSAQSLTGDPAVVNYPAPTVNGGTTPVTTSCLPSSGSRFPVGTTKANCTARDSSDRTASCTFAVTVTKVPQLGATRFVAFGDSITAGVIATSCPAGGGVNCSVSTSTMSAAQHRFELQKIFANLEETTAAYPRALQTRLAARYAAQSISIANEGVPGEFVVDGKRRLAGTLGGSPQALLLLEGANDMNQSRPPTDAIVEDLRVMVREGRGRGMTVLVATLLPQRQTACRGYDFCDGVNDTFVLNAKIRTMVASESATLVDLYPSFDGQTNTLLGLDGLHPNEAGYQKMADLFFQVIQQTLEIR